MIILTYNIWFDELDWEHRLKLLLGIIKELSPDVLCLQEITKKTYEVLKTVLITGEFKYIGVATTLNKTKRYGEAIFYRNKNSATHFIKFDKTTQERGFIVVELEFVKPSQEMHKAFPERFNPDRKIINFSDGVEPGPIKSDIVDKTDVKVDVKSAEIDIINTHKISIVTTHLESEFRTNTDKLSQYKQLLEYKYNTDDIIIAGDTNILSKDEKYIKPISTWEDAWIKSGSPQEAKYTYDCTKNEYIQVNTGFVGRLDRVFYKSKTIKLVEYKLIGADLFGKKCQPSDHFGVFCRFEYTG
ncbi:MAG: endonuclease/exonuclease/phosphatase family protein [Faunusvirus sp.]|jgi:endonuclease/exonuclease/phosphatase family metal-dependent hydrolase|uniref:Endonuclease/exonuclease/phosphatase family protein n=1 Tax=Faunusvirus sp. TaxID=2487766 RepID=A0A3G4ZZJ4_9VIRU|nr:MAG: endonuclease/exonuclease/phosphatase family protein [Faunusvirus sp.]